MISISRALRAALLLSLSGALLGVADGAEFHLLDGTVRGAWIGEANGSIHVLTDEGKRVEISEETLVWVDWAVPVPAKLEKKIVRAREKFIEERRKVARRLIRTLERSDEAERPSILAELDEFDEAQSLHAYSDGLESKEEFVREICFERLEAFDSEAAVVPFVRVHVKYPDVELAERALAVAREKQPELTRRLLEYVGWSASIPHRERAIQSLGTLGDRDALPGLVKLLHYVDMEIKATVGRVKEIREVPINLGGTTTAAQGVTIDLPQMELIQVQTSVRIPVESLRRLSAVTLHSLRSISGADHGHDTHAWAKMVREEWAQKKAQEKAGASKGSEGASVDSDDR